MRVETDAAAGHVKKTGLFRNVGFFLPGKVGFATKPSPRCGHDGVIKSGFKKSVAQRWFGVANCAPASWTTAALCRFLSPFLVGENGRGVAEAQNPPDDSSTE